MNAIAATPAQEDTSSEGYILRQVTGAGLLTAENGKIATDEDDRRKIALFDNGTAIIVKGGGGKWDPRNRSIVKDALSLQLIPAEPRFLETDVNTLMSIYKTFGVAKSAEQLAAEAPDIEKQKIMANLIRIAGDERSSDIHIRILKDYTEIRNRVYGRMKDMDTMSVEDGKALIRATFAVASDKGNTDSELSFQQGALTAKSRILPPKVEMCRLQYSPTSDGRGALIMRLKYFSNAADTDIDSLGYDPQQIEDISTMRKRTNGLYILAGKVSSGKSTTLQRVLNKMFNDKQREISMFTIEEPVELELPGAIQVAAKKSPDGTDGFIEAMKSALRSDPNIIVLGEIRSSELAALAIQAVMTGHAMWSTVHAGSALGILDRLSDLKVETWKLQDPSVIRGLVYQRLTGVICKHCRTSLTEGIAKGRVEHALGPRLEKLFDQTADELWVRGAGCSKCTQGLSGRTVVAETIQTDEKLLEMLKDGDRAGMRRYWLQPKEDGGMGGIPVLHHALSKVGAGLCDINEVEEEVDLLSVYEKEFIHLKPRLLQDVKRLQNGG